MRIKGANLDVVRYAKKALFRVSKRAQVNHRPKKPDQLNLAEQATLPIELVSNAHKAIEAKVLVSENPKKHFPIERDVLLRFTYGMQHPEIAAELNIFCCHEFASTTAEHASISPNSWAARNNLLLWRPTRFEELLLRAYPNPERKGCPGSEALRAAADNAVNFDDPTLQHIRQCSPCFGEFRVFRDARRNRHRLQRLAVWSSVAASSLCACQQSQSI